MCTENRNLIVIEKILLCTTQSINTLWLFLFSTDWFFRVSL